MSALRQVWQGLGGRPLVAIALGLIGAMSVAGCSSREERVDSHLVRARDMIAHLDYDRAGVELRNVMQLDPRRAEAWLLAGRIEEMREDRPRAYGYYSRVVELDPDDVTARIRMARILVRAQELALAERRAGEVLAMYPDNDDAHAVQASILAGRGNKSAALNLAGEVLARSPGQVDAAGVAAALLLAEGSASRAADVLESALSVNPDDLELRSGYSIVLSQQGDAQRLQRNLREMIRIAPTRFEYRLALARSLGATGTDADNDAAEAVLRDAVAAAPGEESRRTVLVDWLLDRRGTARAKVALQQMVTERPAVAQLHFMFARIEESLGRASAARARYISVIREAGTTPPGLEARLLLAELELRARHTGVALARVAEVLELSPRNNHALMLRAGIALASGDAAAAVGDLRSVAKDQPGAADVIGLLALAHRSSGEPQMAREVLASAQSLFPQNPDLALLAAEHLAATGDSAAAVRAIGPLIARSPGFGRAYEVKAAFQAGRRDLAGAERTLIDYKRALPKQTRPALRLGAFYMAQGRRDLAVREYAAAHALAPRDPAIAVDLAEALRHGGQPELAQAQYQEQLAQDPDNDTAANNLAWLLQERGGQSNFDQALELASRFEQSTLPSFLDTLGWVRLRRGDTAGAVAVLRRALALSPDAPLLLYHLGAALIRAGEVDEGRSLIRKALDLRPNFDDAPRARQILAAR